jgi:hypothetical protein
MAQPSQVVVLAEDNRQQQLVRRYLRRCGLEPHAMRLLPCPAGSGSGEQWVRERFLEEVKAYRRRSAHAKTALIVIIDADNLSVQARMSQLDRKLDDGLTDRIRADAEQIARLVPKRNIETWILCLNDRTVDEETDYSRTGEEWAILVSSGVEALYGSTRPNAQLPANWIPSLKLGVEELRILDL